MNNRPRGFLIEQTQSQRELQTAILKNTYIPICDHVLPNPLKGTKTEQQIPARVQCMEDLHSAKTASCLGMKSVWPGLSRWATRPSGPEAHAQPTAKTSLPFSKGAEQLGISEVFRCCAHLDLDASFLEAGFGGKISKM